MVGAYLAERFSPRTFVPLALAITGAASGGGRSDSGARFGFGLGFGLGLDAGFALLLLAQFRAWDDLADRNHDARTHPERVLVRATSIAPIIALSTALAVLNLFIAIQRDATGVAVVALLVLTGALVAWYSVRTARTAAGDHLLLSKYAAMVIVVAGSRTLRAPGTILGAALALHFSACLYEAWHDPASPLSIGGLRWHR